MSKKILTLIIVCLLTTLGIQNSIYAQDVSQATDETIQSNTIEDKIISPKIEKELKLSISKVYGEDKTDEIYNRIVEIAKQAKEKRPEVLKQDDLNKSAVKEARGTVSDTAKEALKNPSKNYKTKTELEAESRNLLYLELVSSVTL